MVSGAIILRRSFKRAECGAECHAEVGAEVKRAAQVITDRVGFAIGKSCCCSSIVSKIDHDDDCLRTVRFGDLTEVTT